MKENIFDVFVAMALANDFDWTISTCRPHDQFTKPHYSLMAWNLLTDFEFETEGANANEALEKCVQEWREHGFEVAG